MMKALLSMLMVIVILPSLLSAQLIEVDIEEVLGLEILGLEYDSKLKLGEPFKVGFEVFNSGSVGYRARVRLEIVDEDLYYNSWSKEISLWPGENRYFEVYSIPMNRTGNFTAKVRIYLANEIKELNPIKFEVKEITITEKDIQITQFRVYENKVDVGISSDQELKNVIIVPSDYPMGWIFEQSKIDELDINEEKKVELKYEPTIWKPTEIMIHVFTEDGKHYTNKSFLMEREKPFFGTMPNLLKIIRILSVFFLY